MTVTRDVVLDMLPLYFAGQVSADTKKLVEDFLQSDPDFARMSGRFDALLKERGPAPAEAANERRAFERTRMRLRYRNQLIGFATAFSLLPFSFLFRDGHIEFFMLADKPGAAILFATAAIGCWVAVYVLGRRARF